MEKWNAYTRDGQLTDKILIRGEAIPEGLYFMACGVLVRHVDGSQCIFYGFACVADCDKNSVKLQEGETEGYVWMSEAEFIEFVNSGRMIPTQYVRYEKYFRELGYIK